MSVINARRPRSPKPVTHQGGPAARNPQAIDELRRSAMTALLFEDKFYEKGSDHAKRVKELVPQCDPEDVVDLAIAGREQMHLRMMPLFLLRELARTAGESRSGSLIRAALARVIQRADEIPAFLSLYFGTQARVHRGGRAKGKKGTQTSKVQKISLASSCRRGLADAFAKFDEYQLAKYRRDKRQFSLRDAFRMVQPSTKDAARRELYRRLLSDTLAPADTWESRLSGGQSKKEAFEGLLRERKLGGFAFLRNLRNMLEAKVDHDLLVERLKGKFPRVLPFRFITAAEYAKSLAGHISDAMIASLASAPRINGKTVVLVDVSGSMQSTLSGKSQSTYMDAACGVAVYFREVCDDVRIFAFSDQLMEAPAYRGLPLVQGILNAVPHGGTHLGAAVQWINDHVAYDRLVVLTDEQSADRVPNPRDGSRGYMVNVASYEYGVAFGPWVSVSGWSERVVDFVRYYEGETLQPVELDGEPGDE